MILVKEDFFRKINEVDVGGQPVDNNTDQGSDDYTAADDMNPVNPTGNDNQEGDQPTDNNEQPTDNQDQGDADDSGDVDDYTTEGGDDDFSGGGDDADGEGGDEGGDAGGDAGSSGGDGQIEADDARGLEGEIFKDLTQDQIDLKHKELKSNFTAIYDTTSNLIDRVNEIPNNENYTSTITFVSEQLANLRQMVTDYMNNVYSTKSYMENAMNYNRFLATLKGINDILKEISDDIAKETAK